MPLTKRETLEITKSIAGFFPLYTKTFVTVLDDMLTAAEARFGVRDYAYSVTAVQFAGNNPKVKGERKNPQRLVIYLSFRSLQHIYRDQGFNNAVWQMAHEVVHVLSHTAGEYATVLEEGLACCFQREYILDRYGYEWPPETWSESYRNAYLMASEMLKRDPDVIRKLRQTQPTISLITAETIREQQPQVSPEIAETLAARFIRGEDVRAATLISYVRLRQAP